MLDHTDLQNVNVYVEAASYVVDQLGERFDQVFIPCSSAFAANSLTLRTISL